MFSLPEVMFLDILMPRLSGYDLARTIREQQWGKHVSLVAFSGWGSDDDQRESGKRDSTTTSSSRSISTRCLPC